jgi:TetR/AcrR family transcriptional regulator, acrAB operon repressor
MPKLTERVLEKNQVHIEDAALRVFTRQGFHGTSVREIAAEAGVSLGNLYNYYKTKEDIFVSLLKRFDQRMARIMATRLAPLIGSLDSDNLQKLSGVVREIVRDHPDYWRLMYIDVVEFGNQHFAHIFRDLIPILRRLNPQLSQKKVTAGIDPTVAFAAIYLQFFTYYLVETLFGGKQHLGLSDDDAISQLIRLYTAGVGSNGNGKQSPTRRRRK